MTIVNEFSTRVEVLPSPLIASALSDGLLWREFGRRLYEASVADCPVDTGDLKKSLEIRYEHGVDPRILIGSRLTVDSAGTNLLALVLLGTEAHEILGNPILAFTWHGEQVFFASVQHPGTKKNPFIQRAVTRIVHNYATAAITLL